MILTPPTARTKPGSEPSLVNPAWHAGSAPIEGLYAEVRTARGQVAQVSKLAGESTWTVDALFGSSSMPIFMNGYGARYLRTHTLAADLAAELDAAPIHCTCAWATPEHIANHRQEA